LGTANQVAPDTVARKTSQTGSLVL